MKITELPMTLILTNVIQGMILNNIQEVSTNILGNANAGDKL